MKMILGIIVAAAVSAVCMLYPEEQNSTVNQFRDLVDKWVELRKQAADEEADWKEEESALKREEALLLQEKKELETEKKKEEQKLQKTQTEYIKEEMEKEKLEQKLKAFETALSAVEEFLIRLKKKIPEPLFKQSLEGFYNKIENNADTALSARLQTVLDLFAQINYLQHSINMAREVLWIGEEERECDVIYLGLCCAYFVSDDEEKGGMGMPGKEGWTWEWRDSIAPRVRNAIECFRQEKKARFINVPLKIGTGS